MTDLDGKPGNEFVVERTQYGDGTASSPDRKTRIGQDPRGATVAVQQLGTGGGLTVMTRDPKGRVTLVDGPDVPVDGSPSSDLGLLAIEYNFVGQRMRVVRPTSVSDPLTGPTWSYGYDKNGNVLQKISPSGNTIGFGYDSLNRVVIEDYPPINYPITATDPNDIVFTYDDASSHSVDRLRSVTAPSRQFTKVFAYDYRGRVATKVIQFGAGSGLMQFPFAYSYDNLDRHLSTTFPDQEQVKYEYLGAMLHKVTESDATNTTTTWIDNLAYHQSGKLQQIDFPLGAVSGQYDYDPSDYRLKSARALTSGTVQQNLNFTWDRAGNLLTSADSDNQTTLQSEQFSYDSLGRLQSAAGVGTYGYTATYQYDAAANLRAKGTRQVSMVESQANMATPRYVTESGSQTGAYDSFDPDGNPASITHGSSSSLIFYNADNRLAFWTDLSKSTSFSFDENGTRIEKYQAAGASQGTTWYVDGQYEVDLTNPASPKHSKHIFVGGRRVLIETKSGSGQLNQGGTADSRSFHYLHTDQLGTAKLVTNNLGQVEARAFFEAYGAQIAMLNGSGAPLSAAAQPTNYLFAGSLSDSETGLYQMGARFYDPFVGRFVSPDPSLTESAASGGFLAGQFTPYAYTDGNPTSHSDPLGTFMIAGPNQPNSGYGYSGGGYYVGSGGVYPGFSYGGYGLSDPCPVCHSLSIPNLNSSNPLAFMNWLDGVQMRANAISSAPDLPFMVLPVRTDSCPAHEPYTPLVSNGPFITSGVETYGDSEKSPLERASQVIDHVDQFLTGAELANDISGDRLLTSGAVKFVGFGGNVTSAASTGLAVTRYARGEIDGGTASLNIATTLLPLMYGPGAPVVAVLFQGNVWYYTVYVKTHPLPPPNMRLPFSTQ